MNHEQVDELLPGYALSALDAADQEMVEFHLRVCVPCQIVAESDRAIVDQLAFGVPVHRPPAALRARLMARLASDRAAVERPASTARDA